MGDSDHKMIFATSVLCMLLLASVLDVVMAQEEAFPITFFDATGSFPQPVPDDPAAQAPASFAGAIAPSDSLNRVTQGMAQPPAAVTPTDPQAGGDAQTSPPRTSAGGAPKPEQAAWIEPQNKARAEVGLGPLTWNTTIEAYAKNYANQRAADCKLEHSDSKGLYGECIETSGPGKYPTPPEIVRWWVDEEKPFYDAGAKKCKGGVCGHYMQVINPNTNQLGCATVPCKGDKGYFSTCNYNW